MKLNAIRKNGAKSNVSPGRTYLKFIPYLLILAIGIVFLAATGAIYLQVVALTTPYRDQTIGTLDHLLHQEVTLTTADGLNLSGWYIPGTQPNAIVIVHGIHANRAYLIPQAEILAQAGYHLLLLDLRGHGLSEGDMVTYGGQEALDVAAGVNFLVALPEVKQIGALGHSLGAAAVVRAAANDPRLQALVIQSSFSSLSEVVEDSFDKLVVLPKWPLAPLIITLAEFRTGVSVEQIDLVHALATMPPRPVFIIHSADDNLFPLHYAQAMYNAASQPKELWIIDQVGGHINPITGHEAEYKERILQFFEAAFAR